MTTKARKPRTTAKSALAALNALPRGIQVNLTRYGDGSWECDASRIKRGGIVDYLPCEGEGRTANEAAGKFLAQYHGGVK